MKIALVHDWLLGMRGGERCLEVIARMFPGAEIYTLFFDRGAIPRELGDAVVATSALDSIPFARRIHRQLLPFFPLAARDLERSLARRGCDVMISVSHCAAKNVRPPRGVPHLCYCLTPARYLWDLYDVYFGASRAEPAIRRVIERLRAWDLRGSEGVTEFVAISEFVAARIERTYGRRSRVVYPPVRTDWIRRTGTISAEPPRFLAVNALVPYKRTEAIVRAFNDLGLPLTVVGSGPEGRRLRAVARQNVSFVEALSDDALAAEFARSSALIFAAEEDFGMVPVEAQAAGRPVICYARGGSRETVRLTGERPTGIPFHDQTPDAIAAAVREFISRQHELSGDNCSEHAAQFSVERFERELHAALGDLLGARYPMIRKHAPSLPADASPVDGGPPDIGRADTGRALGEERTRRAMRSSSSPGSVRPGSSTTGSSMKVR